MTIIEELDIDAWVDRAPPDKRQFREAVHIVLSAISTSSALRSKMVMKGGLLMAIRYDSGRYTRDVDFSTKQKYVKGDENQLLDDLDESLAIANQHCSYDTMCLRQRTEIRPARNDAQFTTLSLSIGYAQRSKANDRNRLLNKQSPTVVQIDYSYNEAVYDVEVLTLSDGEELQAYSFLNLVAEKMRSVLQQPIRNRNRRQDIYDLNLLISGGSTISQEEKLRLLNLFVSSCRERSIEPNKNSFADPTIKKMAQEGYEELAPEVEGPLPEFNLAYSTVQNFYESLAWDSIVFSI